jgi:tetratricopeptide (TPR) repeat protein
VSRATDYYFMHGSDLLDRYRATGHYPDLLGAVDAFRQLVSLYPRRSQDAPAGRFFLCIALRQLYDVTNDVSILREAVDVGVAAAKAMQPDRPSYATGVLNLAVALRDLGKLTRDVALVDDAIGYGRWAAETLDRDHPLRPDAVSDLAAALHLRYELTGQVQALHEAVSAGWQALELVPEGHAQRTAAPYLLSQYLEQLYKVTRDPRALDDAISVSRWGVQISYGDPHYGDHLRHLANLLRDACRDRGDLEALREAIHLLRTAVTHLPRETRNAAMILISLGSALETLGTLTDDAGTTQEALQWLRQARAGCGNDTALAATADHNLMHALGSLYKQTRQPNVLAEAVQVGRQALQRTPSTAKARREQAGMLAATLTDLANAADADRDLQGEIVSLSREAHRITQEGAAD